ncbi:hypothetical protein CYV15_08725 [Riemerella anatipestifer]|uniref:hypothetical protein n=1 Tax=Riemerella anatipestifer TaxID=34085 RepID=UPI000D143B2D|nr:hypothetical protein [Riemerella anatipestifer]PST43550.1 hypothetical protein CYV15_08725 [Riemerella anatipestifer]
MKIQVKIEQETLQMLNQLMGNYDLFYKTLPDNKTGQSIVIELRDILFKKGISCFSNNQKTATKLSLRYHTVEALCLWIKYVQENFELGNYENSKLELLKNDLFKIIIQ